jgi:hypothetical protein
MFRERKNKNHHSSSTHGGNYRCNQ